MFKTPLKNRGMQIAQMVCVVSNKVNPSNHIFDTRQCRVFFILLVFNKIQKKRLKDNIHYKMLLAQSEILIQSIMKKYYKTIVKLVLLLSMKPTSK